jgi:hypothetical protein
VHTQALVERMQEQFRSTPTHRVFSRVTSIRIQEGRGQLVPPFSHTGGDLCIRLRLHSPPLGMLPLNHGHHLTVLIDRRVDLAPIIISKTDK